MSDRLLKMTERDLQRAVLERAQHLGWRVAHFATSRSIRDGAFLTAQQGHRGFPDLVFLRPPRLMFVELKSARGIVDFDQATWLNGLETVVGVETHVWKPEDWPDAIETQLR